MKATCHRLDFTQRRGPLLAVAETAIGRGKQTRETRAQSSSRPPITGLLVRSRFGLPSLLLGAIILVGLPTYAQIVSDHSAPANQQPTVLNAANGVPLVNIQTPSAAGVSRNTYTQFDVQTQGAILNNARNNAQTQLGGWVQGNPSLGAGTARVILNEVNSSNPSLLKGFVEVAGDRAQVVIANPSGISCDGCGFINANRATLTTGTPQFSGGDLTGYQVRGGNISITGAGLDASRTDYTDLIARAVQINAGLWANTLKVTAGANQVSADNATATPISGTGSAPAFAIDVAQLGGMYAGKITLVGTEAGVGVRNAGTLGASAGEVVVTTSGQLQNTGRLTSQGNTRIDAGDIANSGTVYAQGDLSLQTSGNLNNQGILAARNNTTIVASGATSQITQTVGAILGAGVASDGTWSTPGDLSLSGADFTNGGGSVIAGGNLNLSLGSGTLDNRSSLLQATGDVTLSAGHIINRQTRNATPGALPGIGGRSVTLTATDVDNTQGAIAADQTLTLNSGGTLNNTNGLLSSVLDLNLLDPNGIAGQNAGTKTLSITNTGGTAIAGRTLTLDSARLTGDGSVLSLGDLNAKVLQDYLHTGQLQANGALSFTTAGTLTNQALIQAGTTLALKAATLSNDVAGQFKGIHLRFQATDTHTFNNRGLIDGQDTFIDAITLNNLGTGRIYGDHVALSATTLNNTPENGVAPVIAARNRLDIGATTINNADGALIYSAGDLMIGGSLDGNHQATGQAASLTNSSAKIQAEGNLGLYVDQVLNQRTHFSTSQTVSGGEAQYVLLGWSTPGPWGLLLAAWVTQTDTLVTADSGAATISAGGNLSANGAVTNDKSDILAGGNIVLDQARYTGISQQGQTLSNAVGATYYCTGCAIGGEYGFRGYFILGDPSDIHAGGSPRNNILASKASLQAVVTPQILEQWSRTGVQFVMNQMLGYLAGYDQDGNMVISPTDTGGLTPYYQMVDLRSQMGFGSLSAYSSSNNVLSSTTLAPARLTANQAITGTATQISNLNLGGGIGQTATGSQSAASQLTVPNNSLYTIQTSPTAHYLVATDPKFANYQTWLSSDYMLQALSIDPATVQKRLGDGFYEASLIRDQVAQLTGRRFLSGYSNDQLEYQALMDQGVTFAQAHQLVPGVALTAAQIAQLTSDIVWLVSQTVTLPDGTTTQALVPQLYVRVRAGDLSNDGALIAADTVNLQVSGDVTNGGTIAGRNVLALNGANLNNLGGRLTGNQVSLTATNDMNNVGGEVRAESSLALQAGRDLNLTSTTVTETGSSAIYHRQTTTLDRVAGLYVSKAGGTLVASAGRDLNLTAAAIDSAGSAQLQAGNNVNLKTVATGQTINIDFDADNYTRRSTASEAGTTLNAQNTLSVAAGQDLSARAATLTSTSGGITLGAGRNLTLEAGETRVQTADARKDVSSGFLSSKTTIDRTSTDDRSAQATTVSGNTVTAVAGQDLTVKGSNVVGTQDVTLAAGNTLNITAAEEQHSSTQFHSEKESGLFTSGGLAITLGTRSEKQTGDGQSTTLAKSQVGSVSGNVNLLAGSAYQQVASDVLAPQGDVSITAPKVDILAGTETSQYRQTYEAKQSGLTLGITSPIVTAVQTAEQMSKAASQTSDPRMKALAAASTALAVKNAYDAVQAGQALTDGNLADKVGGVSITLSLGASQSKSQSSSTSATAVSSTVTAGSNLNLQATSGDLSVIGSTLTAGNNASLSATEKLNLEAAASTSSSQSTSSGSSASIGVGVGLGSKGGIGVTLSASQSKGKSNGADTTYTDTTVQAGNTATLTSGSDTNLKGASVTAQQVIASVGGNLNIESLQDTSTYKSSSSSSGFSLTVTPGGIPTGGSLSVGSSKINSDYQSVNQQSGIQAGDKGFQVSVQGNTDLKGAVIASTDKAVQDNKNTFTTGGTLTLSDLQNKASYEGKAVSINLGAGTSQDGKLAPQGTSAGFGETSGNASSTTTSGISGIAGNQAVRTGDSANGIQKLFDAAKVQNEINAQVQITQQFGQQATKAVGDYATTKLNEAATLRKQSAALKDSDPTQAAALEAQAKVLEDQWSNNGTLRLLAHTLIGGLTGGADGAAGAAAGTITAPLVAEKLAEAGITGPLATTLTALASTAVGAAAGGTAGGASALNEVANNYLNHVRPTMLRLSEKERYENAVVACDGGDASACQTKNELAFLSRQRDLVLMNACLGSTPDICSAKVQDAIAMGNFVYGSDGGLVYANSPESGPVRYLNTATIGPIPRPDSFHDQIAKSTAEGLLLESGNQALGALVGAATKGVAATSKAVTNFFAANGVSISESTATQIALNFGRDGDQFTIVSEQMMVARNSNWTKPDGRIWWPPGNGNVPGTEFQTTLQVGAKLDRYGGTSANSSFLSPVGTPINERALSPITNLTIRDEYVVLKPLPVEQSNVMPWFGKDGMGIQFDTKQGIGMTIDELVKKGYLRKVAP